MYIENFNKCITYEPPYEQKFDANIIEEPEPEEPEPEELEPEEIEPEETEIDEVKPYIPTDNQCNMLNEFVDLYNTEDKLYGDFVNDNKIIHRQKLNPYDFINNISSLYIYILIIFAFIINIYLSIFFIPTMMGSSIILSLIIIIIILILSYAICILTYNLIQRNI